MTNSPGQIRSGGHPAVLKPIDSEAALVVVRNNQIDMRQGPKTAVCIMTGNGNEESFTYIEKNTCIMKDQFAAVLGGWAGTPGFFNPSYMQNATIRTNRFLGRAHLGFAMINFTFLKIPNMTLINKGHDNVFYDNDMRVFRATRATVDLGALTRDNIIIDDLRGKVVNRGFHNTVETRPYARIG